MIRFIHAADLHRYVPVAVAVFSAAESGHAFDHILFTPAFFVILYSL